METVFEPMNCTYSNLATLNFHHEYHCVPIKRKIGKHPILQHPVLHLDFKISRLLLEVCKFIPSYDFVRVFLILNLTLPVPYSRNIIQHGHIFGHYDIEYCFWSMCRVQHDSPSNDYAGSC